MSDKTLNLCQARELRPLKGDTTLKLIGEGGFCLIYKGFHSSWGTVAYKKLRVDLIKEPEASRLMEEASIHASLDHKNIVKMLGLVFCPGNYGLILEFMENGDLHEYLHKHNVDWKGKLGFICDVAAGMNYLHGQSPPIIHGDLKISNVLISGNLTAKVCDFGFSQWKKFSELNSVNEVRTGTVTHIPPENWENSYLRKTETFDVYGFGIFLWEVVTQKQPFDQGNRYVISVWVSGGQRPIMDEFPGDVPVQTKEMMKRCWDQDSKKRPLFPGTNFEVK